MSEDLLTWAGLPWSACQLRKAALCAKCAGLMGLKQSAYRPLSNGKRRGERLCLPCVDDVREYQKRHKTIQPTGATDAS